MRDGAVKDGRIIVEKPIVTSHSASFCAETPIVQSHNACFRVETPIVESHNACFRAETPIIATHNAQMIAFPEFLSSKSPKPKSKNRK